MKFHSSAKIPFILLEFFVPPIFFAEEDCLNLEQILGLLRGNTNLSIIIERVKEKGVSFKLDDIIRRKLAFADADDYLLTVIEENTCEKSLLIELPKPGAQVGSRLYIKGKSDIKKDHYLWIFTRPITEESQWRLQEDPKIKNGNWSQAIQLGEHGDDGLEFEIKVILVNKKMNERLKNHLAESLRVPNKDPLPEGVLKADIAVHKVRR